MNRSPVLISGFPFRRIRSRLTTVAVFRYLVFELTITGPRSPLIVPADHAGAGTAGGMFASNIRGE